MMHTQCSGIEESLKSCLSAHVGVQQIGDTWVATLPIETFDKRWVGIFIEPRATDFYFIHDGGKAV